MTDLISCNSCGLVLKNIFNHSWRYQSESPIREFENDYEKIFEYLKSHKNDIFWYWSDLEQTTEAFMKYCPVCKAGEYFSKLKIEDERISINTGDE